MDIMLDLETLGVGDNAAIIQIGACRFYPHVGLDPSEGRQFSQNVDWESQGMGTLEPGTVQWWNSQSEEAREKVWDQSEALPLCDALVQFSIWVGRTPVQPQISIWANAPDFDLRLLRQAFERVGYGYPFQHRQHRDMRTLVKEFGMPEDKPTFVGLEHNALDDAVHQAQWVTNIMKRMDDKRAEIAR